VCLEYLWQHCREVCYCIWRWRSSPELTSISSQQYCGITGKSVGLFSLRREGLSVGWCAVGENILCNSYWQLSTEERVSGSSSPMSAVYHSNTVRYPNTLQATWTASSLVRAVSLNAPSFKNFHHLMFNFKDPKSIIISVLSYMYLRLSSAYCSNLQLPRETLNTSLTVQESSHNALLHFWVLMYLERKEVSSWDCSYPD
jgi:hypothetical protein